MIIIQNNENPSLAHSPFLYCHALLAGRYHPSTFECYLHRPSHQSQYLGADDHQYYSPAILQLRRRLARLFPASNLHVLPIRRIPSEQHVHNHPHNNQPACQHQPHSSLQQHPTQHLSQHLPATALLHHHHQQLPDANPLSQLLRHPAAHHLCAGLLGHGFLLCLLQGRLQ